jgi:hypothetical protein
MSKSRISLRTPSCTTPTNLTVDGCSAQAQASECLNSPHKLLLFPLVRSFTARVVYLHEPVQGLNLSCRSISGLEPELPVTNIKDNVTSTFFTCSLLRLNTWSTYRCIILMGRRNVSTLFTGNFSILGAWDNNEYKKKS